MSEHQAQPPYENRVKIPHLVFGLLFLGIAGVWALIVTEVINEDRLGIVAPAVLVTAGVIGLAASLASSRNRNRNRDIPAQGATSNDYDTDTDTDTAEPELDDHTQEIR